LPEERARNAPTDLCPPPPGAAQVNSLACAIDITLHLQLHFCVWTLAEAYLSPMRV